MLTKREIHNFKIQLCEMSVDADVINNDDLVEALDSACDELDKVERLLKENGEGQPC